MERFPGCTCCDMQLSLVDCACGAEQRYYDHLAGENDEQMDVEVHRTPGVRHEWSKDLSDDNPF